MSGDGRRREGQAVVVALSDFDLRHGGEPLGHANLFSFLRVELGLSRSEAYWLPRYFGLSAREAQEVTAELAPRHDPPIRDLVTRVEAGPGPQLVEPARPAPACLPTAAPPATTTLARAPVQTFGLLPARPARVSAPHIADDVEPLTTDLRRLHVTVSREFLRELQKARDGLSHTIPNATTEQVLQAALRLLLEKQARARGQVKRPRGVVPATAPRTPATPATPRTASAPTTTEPIHRRTGPRDTIPAAVKRAVWERDAGRCTWPLDSGGVCGSTHRLELDHIDPWASWGEATEANLRVVCHSHNALAAKQAFGARCVERYVGDRRGRTG